MRDAGHLDQSGLTAFGGRSAEQGFIAFARRSAEHGFTCARRSAEHGFTLIEIMVALAVFGLAALALIRLESATVRGAAILDETVLAQMVARNVAIDAVTDARPPALGSAGGVEQNGGRAWRWTRVTRPTGDARVLRIDVGVQNAAGRVVARLTMIRPPNVTVVAS